MKFRVSVPLLMVFTVLMATGAHAQSFLWPIPEPLHDRTYISNYLDLLPGSGNGFMEYECGNTHGYDGHDGIDIAVNDFRLADQGVPVIAVAGGEVVSVTFNQFDRNLWPPYQGTGNGVWVRHDDGRYVFYWHLRQNSIPVQLGERVSAGQLLGYVASSGNSPIPHLHFQLNLQQNLSSRQPLMAGACGEAGAGEFANQPDYVGNARLRVLQMGLHRDFDLSDGVYQDGSLERIKQGMIEPAVVGTEETSLGVFVQFQGNVGQRLEVSLEDPNGIEQASKQRTVQTKRRYGWYVLELPLGQSPIEGVWHIRVSDAEGDIDSIPVVFGPQTIMPPRFYPLAGRSIRLNGSRQTVDLAMSATSTAATLSLAGAPPGVRLEGSTLVVGANTNPPQRNTQFAVIARDESTGLQDVFHVQMVNPGATNDAQAFSVDASGFWFDPDHPGQGFAIEVDEELGIIFLAWYTYDIPAGTGPSRQWLVAVGDYQGAFANLDTALTSGGEFARPTPAIETEPGSVGRIRLHLESCDRLGVTYEWGPGREGFIAMQRLLPKECDS